MKTIAVCCGKGGVGKTFSTLSIAVELSLKSKNSKNILIIDLDPSLNSTTRTCDAEIITHTIADIFESINMDPLKAIYPSSDNFPNIQIMAGSNKLDYVEQLISKRKNPDTILKRVLNTISDQFDVVLIDCPPSRGLLVSNAIVACDAFITPFGLDDASIDGVLAIHRLVEELAQEELLDKKPVNLGAFCTSFEKETSRATKHILSIALDFLKGSMLDIKIPGTSHVREAISHQSTLQFDRNHKVCLAYEQLTNHVIKKLKLKEYRV